MTPVPWTPGTYDLAQRFLEARGNALLLGTETVKSSGEVGALLEGGFLRLGDVRGKTQKVFLLAERKDELKNLLNA